MYKDHPPKLDDFLTVVEVDESALFFVGELIKRRFKTEGPTTPRHFVAFYKAGSSEYWPVGYVHHTPWEGCHLCGALVVDELLIKRMRPEHRGLIYNEHGGVAEQLLRESFRRVMDNSKAIWGHVGNERALKVDTRVGFRPTEHQYLMVIWNDEIVKEEEKAELIQKAHAIGVF